MTKSILTLAVLAGLTVGAYADTITLNAVADLRILSIFPTQNDNTEPLATYNASGNEQRTLIQFDYSALAGVTVTSATLRLHGESYIGVTSSTSMDLFRVTDAWSETTASWNLRSTGTSWTNPGGDAVGTSGSQMADPYYHWSGNQTTAPSWYELDATSLVTDAVNGAHPNDGMLLAGALGNTLVFVSREGHTFVQGDANVPELVVNYTPVPEPASILVLAGGLFGSIATMRRKRRSLA